MNIDRKIPQTDAKIKIQFCLDVLEQHGFKKGITWSTTICGEGILTIEELIGALVAAEQYIERRI